MSLKLNALSIRKCLSVCSHGISSLEECRGVQPCQCDEELLGVEIGYKDLLNGVRMGLSYWVIFRNEF